MILLALGANLPGPEGATPVQTCQAAIPRLVSVTGLTLIAVSNWYRTTPITPTAMPDFCNGVIRLEGEVMPNELMAACQGVEMEFGRVHDGKTNAARPLDIDIIDLNGQIRAVPAPILPHPRAHLRAFVLRPIADVAPTWRHPTLRLPVATLLAELPEQGIKPWLEPA
jgi:2-amino-4-hydroxy-6-hydroxymethyldihydropteridine diphosphokinase